MNFSVLQDKKTVDGKVDFLSNILKIDYDKVILMDVITINQKSGNRLNVISKRYYGDEEKMDILMKFNRINNIFMLNEGQTLLIPDLESFRRHSKLINLKGIVKQSDNALKGVTNKPKNPNANIPSVSKIPNKGVIKKKNGVVIF